MKRIVIILLAASTLLGCRQETTKFGAVVPNGNNAYVRGFYNTSPPAPSNGDSVNLQVDSAGNLLVSAGSNSALAQPTTSAAVTKSDATVLACGKGLWVGTGGDLSLKLSGDSAAVTWKTVPSGTYVPGNVIRVMAATTALDVVCLN